MRRPTTFRRVLELGWGVLGRTCFMVDRMARECQVELEDWPYWARTITHVHFVPVRARGKPDAIEKFSTWFKEQFPQCECVKKGKCP